MKRSATISQCGRYRYELARTWVEPDSAIADAYAVFIMLNPSTADASQDDPTIRRCISYARQWGMGGLVVVNLFAWRATDPRELYEHPDEKIGEQNDEYIVANCRMARIVVAAWGTRGALLDRGRQVRALVEDLHVLRLTKDGHPAHPLYLPKFLDPIPWSQQ
jgi:hypothetical protein